ncbi:MAG: hypothetical protein ACJ75G_11760 [Gaiellaceae bacterium]
MLLKILIVGALAIGLMAAIRDGRVLRDAGLLSHCSPVYVNGASDATLQQCSKGRLDGYPDLTNKSCRMIAQHRKSEIWSCEAPIVSSQAPKG